MANTCLQRCLFDDRNDVFWMVIGFRNSGFWLRQAGPSIATEQTTNWPANQEENKQANKQTSKQNGQTMPKPNPFRGLNVFWMVLGFRNSGWRAKCAKYHHSDQSHITTSGQRKFPRAASTAAEESERGPPRGIARWASEGRSKS